ncbi:META domain-containing protein [Paracoccus salsus]|uniref:META domain-containing protein n=1 Tax=Paracoccus salsus TaxID=2911061 RepID=UPI001F42E0FE|nr:META domain-containing protein [Paracoccus salsus]MCF3973040.1 META domain-containing protein [Paracoccus salsus]
MPALSRPRLALVSLVAMMGLAACEPVATATPTGDDLGFIPGGSYVLVGMDGKTVPLRNVTLLVEEQRLSGQGPCNSYSAANNASLPTVALSPIISTKMACKDLELEDRFLSVLQQASEMEFYGGVLKIKSPSTWLIFEHGVRASGADALERARASQ